MDVKILTAIKRQKNALNWKAKGNPGGDWTEDGGFMDGSMPGFFLAHKCSCVSQRTQSTFNVATNCPQIHKTASDVVVKSFYLLFM